MINWVRGNLFQSEAAALVNTVNCVGVMGKGIAYQFKRAYPAMFKDYKARCDREEIALGGVTTFRERGKLIINFPTKRHWRAKSRLDDVEAGLLALRKLLEGGRIRSIAVPPLGCGNGGLDWSDVRAAIARELGGLDDVEIEVFEPAGQFGSRVAKEPRVSLGHYVLGGLRSQLIARKKITLQKAAYFFNIFADEPYFKFTEQKFGPYFAGLDPMMRTIADYLEFTGLRVDQMVDDGIGRRLKGAQGDRLRAWASTIDRTASFVNRHDHVIEALATAHAVLARYGPLAGDELIERFLTWSPEKSERFTSQEVLDAVATLVQEGLAERDLVGWAARRPLAHSAHDATVSQVQPRQEPIPEPAQAPATISEEHPLAEQLSLLG